MFESLSQKLNLVFNKLSSKGRLTEQDVDEELRDVRIALLEADVNFRVVKEFIDNVREKAVGSEILQSISPGQQLIKVVQQNECDIGFAFDGDGDRLGVIDNKGNIVWADQYMIILAKEIASIYNNPKIIMDVKSSKVFFDEIKKLGCDPIMFKTGHSPIKEEMKKLNSPLSGEMSGHVCYKDDFYGYDDAMYVGLRLLRILSNEKKSLNELIAIYPKTTATPEIRIDVEEVRKFKIIDEIKYRLKDIAGELINIDGIRVQNDKGWFLIRASNTQNQLTCRAEALSIDDLVNFTNLIEKQLKISGIDFKFNHE